MTMSQPGSAGTALGQRETAITECVQAGVGEAGCPMDALLPS